MESKLSGHWTDDQLIAFLYGVGPEDGHVHGCTDCQARLSFMQAARRSIERNASNEDELSFEMLAGQRRRIYARLTEPTRWWSYLQPRRLAPAAAAALALSGGLLFYQENHKRALSEAKISDAQLAQEVSRMATDIEPGPTAPLQALFEE